MIPLYQTRQTGSKHTKFDPPNRRNNAQIYNRTNSLKYVYLSKQVVPLHCANITPTRQMAALLRRLPCVYY